MDFGVSLRGKRVKSFLSPHRKFESMLTSIQGQIWVEFDCPNFSRIFDREIQT